MRRLEYVVASAVILLYLAGARKWNVLEILKSNTPFFHGASSKPSIYMENTYSVGMQNRCVLLVRLQRYASDCDPVGLLH